MLGLTNDFRSSSDVIDLLQTRIWLLKNYPFESNAHVVVGFSIIRLDRLDRCCKPLWPLPAYLAFGE